MTGHVHLSVMRDDHAEQFDAMLDEYRVHGEVGLYTGFYEAAWDGYAAYRAMLCRLCAGGWPLAEVVPGEAYFVVDEADRIVGEVYLRLALTPALEEDGGNIGYQIRPSARGKGYATIALSLALARLRELGLERALLTCDSANVASVRAIEKNGGRRIADAANGQWRYEVLLRA